jgi:hypothetical protein
MNQRSAPLRNWPPLSDERMRIAVPNPPCSALHGAQELRELGLGLRVHANEDDEGDESVVRRGLGLLENPGRPLLDHLVLPDGLDLRHGFAPADCEQAAIERGQSWLRQSVGGLQKPARVWML